ncbi:M56 family metallopeptidase [Niallia sp. FSL R7-0271]|uniref:M56 family metallopeptidase n=1 Tax=Niallia sp. FSL R7-0271 TaxID=2921678 RepID=UPI0030F5DE06
MTRNYAIGLLLISIMISSSILIQMIWYIYSLTSNFDVGFNLFQACQALFEMFGVPFLEYILLAFVLFTILHSLWFCTIQIKKLHNLKKKMSGLAIEELSRKWNNRYETDRIQVIQSEQPFAITIGFFKPKIVLSTGLWEILSDEEIESVIYHEFHHLNQLDPGKTYIMELFAKVLWFLPILKWLAQQFSIVREVLADNYAIEKSGQRLHISSALLKMINSTQLKSASFVSFADGSVNYRIQNMIEPNTSNRIKWPLLNAAASLSIFVLLNAIFAQLLRY